MTTERERAARMYRAKPVTIPEGVTNALLMAVAMLVRAVRR